MVPRRFDQSRAAVQALTPDDRLFRRSFADEVAIDFPSARAAVECLCRDVAVADAAPVVLAEIRLRMEQAAAGATVPVSLDLRHTCSTCGGRGEVWDDPCPSCEGDGHAVNPLLIDVRVPPGAVDGDTVRFAVTPRRGPRTRVDLRVIVD